MSNQNQPTERVKELLNPMWLLLPNEDETSEKIYKHKPQKVRVINGAAMAGQIRSIEHFHAWDATKDDFSTDLTQVIHAIKRTPDLTVPEIIFMLERLHDSTYGCCPYALVEDICVGLKILRYEVSK